MRVVYTREALRDLDEVFTFIAENYPAASAGFQRRVRMIEQRIGKWPESAREVAQRPGVRVVPFIRYPYKMFYRVANDAVQVLHIHHAARRPWEEGE
jgi:toxin ParE1/3/4